MIKCFTVIDQVEERKRRIEIRRERLLREEDDNCHPGKSGFLPHPDDCSSSYTESVASSSVEGLYLNKVRDLPRTVSKIDQNGSSRVGNSRL